MIRHRGIRHNIENDAPFIGAVIIAPDCFANCIGCQNQHLKKELLIEQNVDEIISEIINNNFDEGMILGGLEWIYSTNDTLKLLKKAKQNNLKTMFYTFVELNELTDELKQLCDYIKTGKYIPKLKTEDNIQYGVKLATSNQNIYKRGDDY